MTRPLSLMVGQKINNWTLVRYLGHRQWEVACICGTRRIRPAKDIRKSNACGCLTNRVRRGKRRTRNEYEILGQTAAIKVRSNLGIWLEALIDLSDFELVHEFGYWRAAMKKGNNTHYAVSGGVPIQMHRLIIQPAEGMHIDHKNHNGLDNRRENLRVVRPFINGLNRSGPQKWNSCGHLGISKTIDDRYYVARISHHGKYVYSEYFKSLEPAVIAIEAARKRILDQFIEETGAA